MEPIPLLLAFAPRPPLPLSLLPSRPLPAYHPSASPANLILYPHSLHSSTLIAMDTYTDFVSLLSDPEGLQTSPNELFDAPSSECFDIPVDAERPGGGLSCSLCIIC